MDLWKILFVIPVTIINIAIAGSVLRREENIFRANRFSI